MLAVAFVAVADRRIKRGVCKMHATYQVPTDSLSHVGGFCSIVLPPSSPVTDSERKMADAVLFGTSSVKRPCMLLLTHLVGLAGLSALKPLSRDLAVTADRALFLVSCGSWLVFHRPRFRPRFELQFVLCHGQPTACSGKGNFSPELKLFYHATTFASQLGDASWKRHQDLRDQTLRIVRDHIQENFISSSDDLILTIFAPWISPDASSRR